VRSLPSEGFLESRMALRLSYWGSPASGKRNLRPLADSGPAALRSLLLPTLTRGLSRFRRDWLLIGGRLGQAVHAAPGRLLLLAHAARPRRARSLLWNLQPAPLYTLRAGLCGSGLGRRTLVILIRLASQSDQTCREGQGEQQCPRPGPGARPFGHAAQVFSLSLHPNISIHHLPPDCGKDPRRRTRRIRQQAFSYDFESPYGARQGRRTTSPRRPTWRPVA